MMLMQVNAGMYYCGRICENVHRKRSHVGIQSGHRSAKPDDASGVWFWAPFSSRNLIVFFTVYAMENQYFSELRREKRRTFSTLYWPNPQKGRMGSNPLCI